MQRQKMMVDLSARESPEFFRPVLEEQKPGGDANYA